MDFEKTKAILKNKLDRERYEHSLRVEALAQKLCKIYHADAAKAQSAALLHDVSRFLDRRGMLEHAKKLNFNISALEAAEPKLLHARLSRYFAEHEFGVTDPEILDAIEYHTVGRPNMGLLEKIIYVADHAEAGRDHPGIDGIQKLAQQSLDQAIARSTQHTLKYLQENKLPVDQRTIETNRFYSKMS
ncbi:MAG: bis(5'-nucleosyl)-tetraphosphatase (symmetrical) YqeK [Candidatus Margulisiibacteriota bacterium]